MRRRRYLALLGLLPLAGCARGDTRSRTTSTETDTRGRGSVTADPQTPTITTPAPVESTTEPGETRTTEPETTDLPTTPTETERSIRRASGHLEEAIGVYVSAVDISDPDLVSVSPTSSAFSSGAVFEVLNDAREDIDEAEEGSDGSHAEAIERLWTTHTFLRLSTHIQANLIEAYDALLAVDRRLANDSYSTIDDFASTMDSNREEAEGRLEELQEATSTDRLADVDGLGPGLYEEKMDVFRTNVGTFAVVADAVVPLGKGVASFDTHMSEYRNGGTPTFSKDTLTDAADRFADAPRPPWASSFVNRYECMATSRAEAVDPMNLASSARADGNDNIADTYESQAEAALGDC